jgi:hypothetical protein
MVVTVYGYYVGYFPLSGIYMTNKTFRVQKPIPSSGEVDKASCSAGPARKRLVRSLDNKRCSKQNIYSINVKCYQREI